MSDKPTSTMKRRLNAMVALILAVFTITIIANLFKISITESDVITSYSIHYTKLYELKGD